MGFEYISAGKIDSYVNRDDVVIIDLRKNVDYKRGHIEGAINVPHNVIDGVLEELQRRGSSRAAKYTEALTKNIGVDFTKTIVFYCERGSLSLAICAKMSRLGFDVKSVVGGIRQYRGRYYAR